MWAIRILNGPQAGQTLKLKDGKIRIGRAPGLDLRIQSDGVSKEHVEITVIGEKVLFTDLNSSNGTFLNGVKVKGGVLKLGDKLSLHNVLIDLVSTKSFQPATKETPGVARSAALPQTVPTLSSPQQQLEQNIAMVSEKAVLLEHSLSARINDYLNRVVFPSFYQMTEQFEFKSILLGFVGFYILFITLLAIIPMQQITSDSINIESRRRAITVARSLARGNEKTIHAGDISNFSTEFALKEEGVDDVYVLGKDGKILAPPERAGTSPKEIGFFRNVALKAGAHESSGDANGKIAAAIPILGYDPEVQQNVARAYAIVIYNPGSMMFDDGRVLSLFIQMLALAFVAGGILFYLLLKMIEYPYTKLFADLDNAIREGRDHITLKIQFPALQNMLTMINSMLSRIANSTASQVIQEQGGGAKNNEYVNITSLIGFPALLISSQSVILKCNAAFEAITGFQLSQIENNNITSLPDQAMQKNIEELIQKAAQSSGQIAKDKLEIGGEMFALKCQALTLANGNIDGFIVTISPLEGAEENVA